MVVVLTSCWPFSIVIPRSFSTTFSQYNFSMIDVVKTNNKQDDVCPFQVLRGNAQMNSDIKLSSSGIKYDIPQRR